MTVTVLMPGVTDTEFFARADMEEAKAAQGSKADPKDVAKAGYDALMAGDDHVVHGLKNKLQRQGVRDPAGRRCRRPHAQAERARVLKRSLWPRTFAAGEAPRKANARSST